jgi:hypothetical protein
MSMFAPLNFYALAAVQGQFLRPDVQAPLKDAPVGRFSNFVNPRDQHLKRAAEAPRKKLDALLFPEGLPRPSERPEAETPVMEAPPRLPFRGAHACAPRPTHTPKWPHHCARHDGTG